MIELIPASWHPVLAPAFASPEGQRLIAFLEREEAAGKVIYPPRKQRLRAFELTPLDQVRVVILGQDPYHGPGQAHGLAFSVPDGVKKPPSLRNIFRELADDCGIPEPVSGNLGGWARQGVLLLNTALSVEAGRAASHARIGWEAVTDAAVAAVAVREEPAVFILWGAHAQSKAARIPELREGGRHLLIQSPHPSPLSAHRGFFGSRPFSRTNEILQSREMSQIDWLVPAIRSAETGHRRSSFPGS